MPDCPEAPQVEHLPVIRIAAMADVHFGADAVGTLRPHLTHLAERADLLLIAGDLTRVGDPAEAVLLLAELRDVGVPIVTVLVTTTSTPARSSGSSRRSPPRVSTCSRGMASRSMSMARASGSPASKGSAAASWAPAPVISANRRCGPSSPTRRSARRDWRRRCAGWHATGVSHYLHHAPVPDTLCGERLELYPFLSAATFSRKQSTALGPTSRCTAMLMPGASAASPPAACPSAMLRSRYCVAPTRSTASTALTTACRSTSCRHRRNWLDGDTSLTQATADERTARHS